MKNYYAILEVPVGSDISVIRESYRRLVQENLWNKEVFVELKEAYEVLSTPARRMEYDKVNFGQTFAVAGSDADTRLGGGPGVDGEAARHCPMNAGVQCPVLNARVPLEESFCPECGFLLAAMPPEGFAVAETTDTTRQPRLEGPDGRAHRLHAGVNSVGRETADVLLTDKTVSRHHAQIEVTEAGQVAVEDLGSTNGTRVNDAILPQRIPHPAADGDTLRFGSVSLVLHLPVPVQEEVPVASVAATAREAEEPTAAPSPGLPGPSPLELQPEGAAGAPEAAATGLSILDVVRDARARLIGSRNGTAVREDPLVPGVTTFGRRPENSVVLRDDPYISGSHAQIIAEEDVFRLTDLGSTNGTFLNGTRLAPNEPALLQADDEITLGSTVFRFEPRMVEETSESAL